MGATQDWGTVYAYNAGGLVTSQTDALGNVTSYGYNSRNWLTTVTAPDPDGERISEGCNAIGYWFSLIETGRLDSGPGA